ncbi:prominin-2 [Lates calcarifer]|uniref:Prominin-2 n=1 Tax=Lates calcarifer TaxID=8187 RepID=A0AAJ8BJG5_LATCA|nr:prominin-2 [Lates calcarifer]XP_050932873.1 prominin-2 [Lates calcarifer]XP_050932874.1 prominin-2 [Lates calcarifer]XP_050932875.1 prominin-2 [Lates calcarifer]
MGICKSMRVWRWQGSAGALGAGVGVVLLGLGLAQSVPPQTACAAAPAQQSLIQPHYEDTTGGYTSVGFMAAPVQSFLHTVQPKAFPGDLILEVANDYGKVLSNQELIKKALLYEVGFLVCAAIGILYIILMPIVGFFLACCRCCCGNCGGKMYQKQTSSIHCRRRTLYWSAFVTTVIILAGNICMFKSNEDLKVSVDQGPTQLNAMLNNIHTFLTAVPQQVRYVVDESYKTIEEVTRNLDDIGPQLGTEIQERFNESLGPALHSIRLLNQEISTTTAKLDTLNSSLAQLQSSVDYIHANITAVKNRINQTLSNPNCTDCENQKPGLEKLTLDITLTSPSLNEFQSAVDEVNRIDLTLKIKEVEDYFNSIPQKVTVDTWGVIQISKQELGKIKTQISQVTGNIPLSTLTNVSGSLNQLHREIGRFTPEVMRAEDIRWKVCIALCCVVLLVVVCNLLGLILGPVGLTPKADPTKRSCTADCGGTFFMMGAGFSFLFSWLLMIVVLVLFLLGGNIYTLFCRPWNNGQLLKFIDKEFIPEIRQTYGLQANISFSEVYRDCKENKPLWTTLHLSDLVNLDEFLNVSRYTEQIREQFENTHINLSTITLLSPDIQNQLSSFSAKTESFDSTAITQQMNNISRINLNTTAEKLDMLSGLQTNSDRRKELQNEANDLRQIQASIETTITLRMESIHSTIKSLRSVTEKINGTVGEVLSSVGAAQDFLNTNTTQIVKTESRKFLDCQLGYFIAYANWANLTITQEIGRCQPVVGALDSVDIILCSNMVESLNAFWFSLGWCLIFFIPSIIFSIKLAKYYRRMKYSDVFDDHIIMNHIPRAQMKIT